MTNHPNRGSTAKTHIVLWNGGTQPAMLVVSEERADAVQYSRNYDDRLVLSQDHANALCEKIRRLYGSGHDVVVVSALGDWSDQRRRDDFLPAWAWLKKYGQN